MTLVSIGSAVQVSSRGNANENSESICGHWRKPETLGGGHQITAVEYDPAIAAVHADLFPNDELIVGDAHDYLLKNHEKFDFIWSSPPCQTHSSFRYNIGVRYRGVEPKFPDMSLYEQIVFLQYHSKALWVVENVVPYYQPLIPAKRIGRHLYWSNFELPDSVHIVDKIRGAQIPDLQALHGYDLSKYKLANKRQVLRNVVSPRVGLDILTAAEIAQKNLSDGVVFFPESV